MQEISDTVSSATWWFSTVVVAFLINMISSYTKPGTDRLLSRLSERWRQRSSASAAKFAAEVQRLVVNTHALADAAQQEARYRLDAIYMMALSMFLLLFPF